MEAKNTKVILRKPFKPSADSNIEHQYSIELDKFIYENGGCITGWDVKRFPSNAQVVSYECSKDNVTEADVHYFNDVWLKQLSSNNSITGELSFGEVHIDFS